MSQSKLSLVEQIFTFHNFIFDMDGTLMNSEIWHHESWRVAAREAGAPELSSELLFSYGGLPTPVIAERIKERFNLLDADPVRMGERKTSLYKEELLPKVTPFTAICTLLKDLSASGKRIAVATSSHKEETLFLLDNNGLLPYIHAVITGDMVEHGKPNPDIYLLAASKLNAKPNECLVFEDTVVGMKGIQNANMYGVRVFEGDFSEPMIIGPQDAYAPRDAI